MPNDADADLYDADILLWSEQQSALLRRLAAGEQVNDQIDWPNLIEEVESVGSEQLHAVRSPLRQALIHMLKAEAWPRSREAAHWRSEAIRLRADAADRFTPSMAQRIDLAKLYRNARWALPETMGGRAPRPVPTACPVTLEELLAEPPAAP
jgi:hypothetical protein